MTVGERIVQRVVRNGVLDQAISSQGLASQESEEGDNDMSADQESGEEGKDGHKTIQNSTVTVGDCGLRHHLDMRSIVTEV